jgi:hypothetical protein
MCLLRQLKRYTTSYWIKCISIIRVSAMKLSSTKLIKAFAAILITSIASGSLSGERFWFSWRRFEICSRSYLAVNRMNNQTEHSIILKTRVKPGRTQVIGLGSDVKVCGAEITLKKNCFRLRGRWRSASYRRDTQGGPFRRKTLEYVWSVDANRSDKKTRKKT